jgi:putative nucleotidyltransferase with HDIG domain
MIGLMVAPGRVDAAALLLSLDPPPWLLRHSRAVAEIAAFLAARVVAGGTALDPRLVERAALLHDVDKALPREAPERRLRHGEGSAAWLAAGGRPVAVIGLEGVVVVDAGDAILVCRKDRAQDVRKAVDELSRRGRDEVL